MEEMLNSNGLILINSYMCFTPEERKKLEESFEKNDMEIFFIEQRGINNSIFDGIEIILNNNLFNMLVGGVLMPAAYDILKNSLVVIVKKIKNSNVKFLRANKDPEPINAVIKIKTDVGEIIASIDQELTPEEVEKYIEALIMAHKIASNTLDNKNQYFIVDKTSDGELEVLLLSEYLKKHNKI
jgi:hypothetical protein